VLPPGLGVPNVVPQRQISVLRPGTQLVVERDISVPEAAAEVDAGIELRGGDDVAFQAWGTVRAGVWAAGRNGPIDWSSVLGSPISRPV
jgi:hypothetical protein